MTLLILMRLVQAIGSSAVLSVGAGSLADMYEKHERGAKMGLYYGVPLLGPSLGPLIGGILTNVSVFSPLSPGVYLSPRGAEN